MKLELVAAVEAFVATAPEAEPEAVPESPPEVVVSILLIVEVNSAPSSATMLFEELMPLTVTVLVVGSVWLKSLC